MEELGDSSLSKSRAVHAPLLRAILEDDWKAAEAFIQKNPNCNLGAPITKQEGTALHNAAAAKRTRFVKELVKLMTPEQLEEKTKGNCTALYFAAQSKIVTIAEVMVLKGNKNLPLIPEDDIKCMPLYAAIETGNRDMVSYLYSVTPIQELNSLNHINLLNAAISTDLYDTAHKILDILKPAPEEKEYLWLSLEMLAKKPSEIGSKSEPSVWERRLNSCFRGRFCNKALMQASAHHLVDRLWKTLRDDKYFPSTAVDDDKHTMKLLFEAAKVGNLEFLIILVHSYPDLIWQVDEEYGSLFHVAVKHRQERVFNLIYEISFLEDDLASYKAKGGNNMLHLAGQLPSPDRLDIILGPAFQMQRELLWFQEIEKIVPKSFMDDTNEEGETARDIFVNTHKELLNNGEKWMKNTANSCMLVAALIATVVFPAAFTLPGGNNQETGIPIFRENNWFTVFVTSDAVAMLFSSYSILVFLTIHTSPFTEKDFLILPFKLGLGLYAVLIAIVGMLIAFSAAHFVVSKNNPNVPIQIIAILLISYFVFRHYALWFDIIRSDFRSDNLFRSQNRLSNSKPGTLATEIENGNQSGHNDRTQVLDRV